MSLLFLLTITLAQPPAAPAAVAGEAFAKNDCAAAISAYEQALGLSPGPDQSGLYLRRIGICRARLGDIPASLEAYRAGVEAGRQAADKEILEENLHGLGLALMRLGRLAQADEPAQRAFELASHCRSPEHLPRASWLLASILDRTGRARESLRLLESALQLARAAGDRAGIAILLDNLATRYARLGDVELGVRMERESIALSTPGDESFLLQGLVNLAAMQANANRPEQAIAVFREIASRATGPQSRSSLVAAALNIARNFMRTRSWPEALHWLETALSESAQLQRPEFETEGRSLHAVVLASVGRLTAAREEAGQALRISLQSAAPDWQYAAYTALGRVEDASGNPVAAIANYRKAVAIAESLREAGPGDAAQLQRELENQLEAYRLLVSDLIATGRPEAAFTVAEQAKARVLLDILSAGGVNEQKSLSGEEKSRDSALRAAARGGAPAAIQDLERFRRDIYAAHPEMRLQSEATRSPDLAALRSLFADPHSSLLSFFTLEDGIAVFAMRGGGPLKAFRARIAAAEIRSFREALARRDLDYKPAARRLFGKIIGPALPLVGDTASLVISPDGPLWELPFGALIGADGRHLLEKAPLSLTPSLSVLLALRSHTRPRAGLELLAVGNPGSAGTLPDAAREVSEISRLYPPATRLGLTGSAASAAAFRRDAARARVIHVAAHAELNDTNPLYSAIDLGPTRLTALDLLGMRLNADLVVLAACETALGRAAPGEGMMGMGWALAAAGARSSVLSYWKVASGASGDFMIAFHRAYRNGAAKPESLRQSALRMMAVPATRHPYYWAAFALFGDATGDNRN